MIFFIISFIAGVLTVLAPCTLPLLPVIIGGSLDGQADKKKAFVIVGSLSLSIILFTFLLKYSTVFISVPQFFWMLFSAIIIILFGLVSIFPAVWESLPIVGSLSLSSNKLMSAGYQKKSIWGDVIIGASLGPVFSTCSPTYFIILATVLPRSLSEGFLDLLAYTVGLSLALLLIAFVGQKIVSRLGGISDTHGVFRRTLGVIFVILGLCIIFGLDKVAESKILSSGFFDVTQIEQKLLTNNQSNPITNSLSNSTTTSQKTDQVFAKSSGPVAPEFADPTGFINTGGLPITLAQYKGKAVVLLDFWTYSCINCQRTLPYVESWYEKYKSDGLVVIGIHTPEFSFEKVQSNVEEAVKGFSLTYPIILDSNYGTWNAYSNQYWPMKYLINGDGEIIYEHAGEGNYSDTEKEIQKALSEFNQKNISADTTSPKNIINVDAGGVQSPETYFGSNRNEYLTNGTQGLHGQQTLHFPSSFDANRLYLDGVWNFYSEYANNLGSAKIEFDYSAKNVYIVASSDLGATITVMIDGKKTQTLNIKDHKLYQIVSSDVYGEHTMQIIINSGTIDAYTFTFG